MSTVHNFHERLTYSQKPDDEAFWLEAYRAYFPDMVSHACIQQDCTAQRRGMDRLIVLGSGAVIAIDEKKRAKARGDILLEYLANDRTGAPGWIEKELQIDFIAYAFMETRRVYLLNWGLLRRAWRLHKEIWKRQYPPVAAKNSGYTTYSTPVPIGVLLAAVAQASVVTIEPSLDDIPF